MKQPNGYSCCSRTAVRPGHPSSSAVRAWSPCLGPIQNAVVGMWRDLESQPLGSDSWRLQASRPRVLSLCPFLAETQHPEWFLLAWRLTRAEATAERDRFPESHSDAAGSRTRSRTRKCRSFEKAIRSRRICSPNTGPRSPGRRGRIRGSGSPRM